jgi:PAS domain-containing protein
VQSHNLVLILARDFASRLATPTVLLDADGAILYFNEAAEPLLGRKFVEGERIPEATWLAAFRPVDDQGVEIPADRRPIGSVLGSRKPAHGSLHMTGMDGARHAIEITAFPLFARAEEFVGVIAIFWEDDEDARAAEPVG